MNDTAFRRLCGTTAGQIELARTAHGADFEALTDAVVEVFKGVRRLHGKAVAADVFSMLDGERYSSGPWHSALRRIRNTPAAGRRLFAVWR